jgi:hypothetical protein
MRPTLSILFGLSLLLVVSACTEAPDADTTLAAADSQAVAQPVVLTTDAAAFEDTGVFEFPLVAEAELTEAVRAHFAAEGLDNVTVDVLDQTADRQTLLVTRLAADTETAADSTLMDERFRVVFAKSEVVAEGTDAQWQLVESGRQVRCTTGAVVTEWNAAACN